MKKNITTRLRVCSLLGAFALLSPNIFGQNKNYSIPFSSPFPPEVYSRSLMPIGVIKTETEQPIIGYEVSFTTTHAILPPSIIVVNDFNGAFTFPNPLLLTSNTIFSPSKNDNPLNGVSTYDLLLMSKHILGITPLSSPYKLIAADINKSGSITTFDIVALRKIILGIHTEFQANTSWRFVDFSYVFPTPDNPFLSPFPETRTSSSIDPLENQLFVGIKIGDMNNNVIPNLQSVSEERTLKNLPFSVQDQNLKAGETYTIHLSPEDLVEGYQFTLEYPSLNLLKITPSEGMEADNFAIFKEKNLLTTSFIGNKKGEFDLTFVAEKDGQLSDFLKISNQVTKAEAYTFEREQNGVELRFLPKKETNSPVFNLEITPNPIIDEAFVTFNLPENSDCTLTVFDNLGRLLWEEKKEFQQGENRFSFKPQSKGILYFQLETPWGKKTKIIEH
jgi:large repetitive protein